MNQANDTHPSRATNGHATHAPPAGTPHPWDDSDDDFMQLVHEVHEETGADAADGCCAPSAVDCTPGQR